MIEGPSVQPSDTAKHRMHGHQWRGLLVCLLISVGTFSLFPIASHKWPRIAAFLPAYQTAIIFAYAVASYLIYTFYKETKATSLLYLWSGCLYTAVILVVQFLSFPGAFIPDGPLIGGQQTTIWLWCFWHLAPTLMLVLYAWLEWKHPGKVAKEPSRSFNRVALFTILACAITIASVTLFHDFLPAMDVGGDFTRITTSGVAPLIQILILAAMFMLWRATGFRRSLDVWLGVALLALLLDNSITMAGGSRLSVGWYVGRINALISAVVMLAIYLKEINTGYLASMQNAKQLARYQSDLENIVAERTRVLEDTKAALLHSQKLEAVGKLTGGVAHDFNNVLHIINGNIELIKHISNGNEQISARLAPFVRLWSEVPSFLRSCLRLPGNSLCNRQRSTSARSC